MDCIFCKIVRGEAPAWKVYEDGEFIVILDKYPASYGHLLVVSKEHYTNVIDAPVEKVVKGFEIATKLAKAWAKLGAPGVNIVTNAGRDAGQMVYHLHIHVIPRWGGKLTWHGREEIREEEAREVVEKLQRVLPEYFK
ncbi:histidine triad (HIT) protein [Pyrobaculum islandicum DSM 4184]|uniref:Histidine triad (HIT) protein n=1 Tax=Pyrobaculum islandicum (strain DSM 4184 / JCM 9189 / GEO3) TaxID=384616 RepID=A1RRX7_PYRIL|nr:HIT family protein [Pyrobaculum islandicum]ABL87709.1 histidine triad (HIT) protein [Pyrobaculum islandicum DSM 4184]